MKKLTLFLVITFICLSACHYSVGLEVSDKAVAEFHEKYNKRQFEELYDEAAIEFKGVYNKEKVIENLQDIYKTLGKVQSTERRGWAIDKTSDGFNAIVNFETIYENGEAKERFEFAQVDDRVELTNYSFESDKVNLE